MAGPGATAGPGSEDIVAAAARTSQAAQLAELNALDGKGANLIGFVGVVLTLIYTSNYADGHWTWALTRRNRRARSGDASSGIRRMAT